MRICSGCVGKSVYCLQSVSDTPFKLELGEGHLTERTNGRNSLDAGAGHDTFLSHFSPLWYYSWELWGGGSDWECLSLFKSEHIRYLAPVLDVTVLTSPSNTQSVYCHMNEQRIRFLCTERFPLYPPLWMPLKFRNVKEKVFRRIKLNIRCVR